MTAARPLREPGDCEIRVDGTEIDRFYPLLRQVTVETTRRAAGTATLVFDTVRTESGSFEIQDAGVFRPWKRASIHASFGSHSEEVLRGLIKEVRAECPLDMSAATVTVVIQDDTLLLDREHLRRNWSREDAALTDGQVVEQLATGVQLQAEAASGLTHTSLNMDGTAIRFLRDRAEANGYELFVREGILHFGPPQLEGEAQAPIMVYAGAASNCLRFSAAFDGHRPDEVRVVRAAERGSEGESETVTPDLPLLGRESADSAQAGLAPFVWTLSRPTGATPAESRSRAQARANENAWKVRAEGELDGALYGHVLLTHRTVEVDGVGETFGGTYYVDEVRHTFDPQGYRQTFKLLRNAIGEQPTSAGDPLAAVRA